MTRGLWRKLLSLPPVDWAALAEAKRARSRWTRKGDKRPRADVERKMASQKANAKARAREAGERRRAEQVKVWRKGRDSAITARMLNVMQPGEWYGRPDIRDLSGVKRNSVHMRLAVIERAGLVRRALNPDFVPLQYRRGALGHFQPVDRPPQWLFTLTPAGEAERARLSYLL
jgi:hypothetical protein